eukprot:g4218.t1
MEECSGAPPTPSLEDVHDMLSREGGDVSFMKRLKRSTYARILMMLKESTDPEASSFDDQMNRISEIFELIDLWVRKRDDTAGIVYDNSAHWSVGTRESFKGKNKRAEALRVGVGMLRQKQLSLQKEKEKYVEMVSSFEAMMTGKKEAPPLAPISSPFVQEKELEDEEEEKEMEKTLLPHEIIFEDVKEKLNFSTNVRKSLDTMKLKTEELHKRRLELEKVLEDLQVQSKLELEKLEKSDEKAKTTTTPTITFREEVRNVIRKWSCDEESKPKPRESTLSSTSTLCSLLESTLSRRRTRLMSECSDLDSPGLMSPGHDIMYGKAKEVENWRLTHQASDDMLHRRSQLAKSLAEHLSKERVAEDDTMGIASLGLAAVSVVAANARNRLRTESVD